MMSIEPQIERGGPSSEHQFIFSHEDTVKGIPDFVHQVLSRQLGRRSEEELTFLEGQREQADFSRGLKIICFATISSYPSILEWAIREQLLDRESLLELLPIYISRALPSYSEERKLPEGLLGAINFEQEEFNLFMDRFYRRYPIDVNFLVQPEILPLIPQSCVIWRAVNYGHRDIFRVLLDRIGREKIRECLLGYCWGDMATVDRTILEQSI